MKVIVNADDYGMNENVSAAIVESFKRGYINQTTLIVNMPWAARAVELAKKEGLFDKIGLHLNLTTGKPLTPRIARCPLFCNASGEFDKRFAQLGNLYCSYSEEIKSLISEEVESQIKQYCDFGLPLRHLDSHHHVHHRLPLARHIMPIMARYGFKSIRMPYSIGFTGVKAFARKIRNGVFVCLAKRYGLTTSGEFGSAEAFETDPFAIRGKTSVELMVHPYYDQEGKLINIVRYDDLEGPLMAETNRLIKEAVCRIA